MILAAEISNNMLVTILVILLIICALIYIVRR